MKYPREIIQKADHILSRRRQIAIQEQARSLGRLSMEHPEVLNAYYSLNRLQAQHGMSLCLGADGAAELMMQIDQAEKALDGRLDAAGLTKACFEPAYTCSLCGDTGSTAGRLCRCKQEILNRLAYDQLCDISAVETCTFDNFDLEYYAEENRPAMRKVVVGCRKYVARFSHSSPNLIFTGSTGLGKTHLSLAIADGIVKSGHMVMYVSAAAADRAAGEVKVPGRRGRR